MRNNTCNFTQNIYSPQTYDRTTPSNEPHVKYINTPTIFIAGVNGHIDEHYVHTDSQRGHQYTRLGHL